MKTIIVMTTEIKPDYIQDDVFFHRAGDPCPQPFQVNTTGLEQCIPFMRFDHFTGNEVAYIFTCIGLGIVPLGRRAGSAFNVRFQSASASVTCTFSGARSWACSTSPAASRWCSSGPRR